MSHYDEWEDVRRQSNIMTIKKEAAVSTYDPINQPKHYNSDPSGIEPINITQHMSFCLGNVIKYCMRYKHKGGVEDLRKAQWYLAKEIERLSK